MTVAAEPSGTQTNVLRSRRGRGGGLRARLAGLAVAGGVLLGVLAFPQAAVAQDVAGWFNGSFNPNPVSVGGQATVISFTVMNNNPVEPKDISIKAKVEGLNDYVSAIDNDGGAGLCTRDDADKVTCPQVEPGGQRTISFTVATVSESDLPEGEQASGTFKVDFNSQSQSSGLNVVGTATTSTISEISGAVTSNAEPIKDAKVVLTDGEGNERDTTTGDDGTYSFTGDNSNPISPGNMTIVVTAEGYEDKTEEFEAGEGSGSITRNITITKVQEEEPSSAAPTSAPPTSAEAVETEEEDSGGMSGTLIFLIVIGALLVVGGIVGIVFLLRGGKDKDDDDDESFAPDVPPDHQPTAAQVGTPGVYQAAPGPGAEAPTMIHPGGLVDGAGNPAAPTQFGPAYGGASDSTQVMPQGGFGAGPAGPSLGPDGTTILPVVKQPGGPGASDATQIMPQANLGAKPQSAPPSPYGDLGATRPHAAPSAPPSPYSDPSATRPHPGPSPAASVSPYGDLGSTRPHPSPTPPPAAGPTGSMFDPQNPGIAPSAPREQSYGAPSAPREQSYGPQGSPSAPQYGPGSQSYGAQGGQPGFGAHGSHSASPSAPRSAPPSSDPYQSQSMRRDPYAPQEQPAPPAGGSGAGEYGATRAMPQYGDQSQPPPAPYGGEPNREGEGEDPDSKRTDRRNWGEWDDRPRSW